MQFDRNMEGSLYPILHGLEECAGVCPICLMDMGGHMPKYDCENGHAMCHRCKPYYWSCSMCDAPLNHVPPLEMNPMDSPPPVHFMPHPMHRRMDMQMPMPSAPPESDVFLANERGPFGWGPPPPGPEQDLVPCAYSHYGCWIRLPEYLRELHETRCQFRPYLEVEHLPTDIPLGDDRVPCSYAELGCNVMMPPWRQPIHEPLCIFKERFEAQDQDQEEEAEDPADDEDPDEMVECKLKVYGCLVKMPRRRKIIHEEKCNYNKYYKEEDFNVEESEEEIDPDSQVDCRWAEQGCRIRPKFHRKEIHEDKCNYKMEPCSFSDNGCEQLFVRARRFAHERNCEFKN